MGEEYDGAAGGDVAGELGFDGSFGRADLGVEIGEIEREVGGSFGGGETGIEIAAAGEAKAVGGDGDDDLIVRLGGGGGVKLMKRNGASADGDDCGEDGCDGEFGGEEERTCRGFGDRYDAGGKRGGFGDAPADG